MGCGAQVQPEMPGASGLVTADPQPQREVSWPVTLPRGWAVTGLTGRAESRAGVSSTIVEIVVWCLVALPVPYRAASGDTLAAPRLAQKGAKASAGAQLVPLASQIFWVQGRVGGPPSRAGAALLLTPLHQVSAPPWLPTPETGGVRDRARAGRGFGHPAGRALVTTKPCGSAGTVVLLAIHSGLRAGPRGQT